MFDVLKLPRSDPLPGCNQLVMLIGIVPTLLLELLVLWQNSIAWQLTSLQKPCHSPHVLQLHVLLLLCMHLCRSCMPTWQSRMRPGLAWHAAVSSISSSSSREQSSCGASLTRWGLQTES
jgi:hypothetical protein